MCMFYWPPVTSSLVDIACWACVNHPSLIYWTISWNTHTHILKKFQRSGLNHRIRLDASKPTNLGTESRLTPLLACVNSHIREQSGLTTNLNNLISSHLCQNCSPEIKESGLEMAPMFLSNFDNQHISKVGYPLVTGDYLAFGMTSHEGVLPSSLSPIIPAHILHLDA